MREAEDQVFLSFIYRDNKARRWDLHTEIKIILAIIHYTLVSKYEISIFEY